MLVRCYLLVKPAGSEGFGGTQVGPSGFVGLQVTGDTTGVRCTLSVLASTSPNTADCVSADEIFCKDGLLQTRSVI